MTQSWVTYFITATYAFAYVRPDHRARFNAAIRIMPYQADPAMRLLAESGTTYLQYAF